MNSGNPLSQSEYKSEKRDAVMGETIVDEETFLASFGKYDYEMAKKYLVAYKLNKRIKNVSEISRQLNHPNRTVAGWLTENEIPPAIRAINFLKSINLMPLRETNSKEFFLFTELSAFLFGDGHLMKHLGGASLCGQKTDLEKIGSKLSEAYNIGPKFSHCLSSSTITKINNGKITKNSPKGSCWSLSIGNSPLARLLFLAGIPAGDKVSISTRVPNWVMSGCKETKRVFLSVLFGNELQCPCLRAKNAFTSVQLGLHKVERRESDLRFFLMQIKDLLSEFKISTSPIASEKGRTIRKNGEYSMKLYFSIDSHSPNVLCLFKEIPFRYAEEKQKRFAKEIETFLKKQPVLKQEWELYEKVMQLHKAGLGRRTIFKQLQLPKNYFYKINHWIHYGQKPLYYGEKAIFT